MLIWLVIRVWWRIRSVLGWGLGRVVREGMRGVSFSLGRSGIGRVKVELRLGGRNRMSEEMEMRNEEYLIYEREYDKKPISKEMLTLNERLTTLEAQSGCVTSLS